jgi:hypothetical protein
MIPDLILMLVTLTCLRSLLKTVREALKTVREAWDLWDRYAARESVCSEEAPLAPVNRSELGGGGCGAGEASAHEQLTLWE